MSDSSWSETVTYTAETCTNAQYVANYELAMWQYNYTKIISMNIEIL